MKVSVGFKSPRDEFHREAVEEAARAAVMRLAEDGWPADKELCSVAWCVDVPEETHVTVVEMRVVLRRVPIGRWQAMQAARQVAVPEHEEDE